eukprot:361643-Chlamydomonas_euryale.AAC.1
MAWHGIAQCDVTAWHGMTWYRVKDMHGMAWHGIAQWDVAAWHGIYDGMSWHGMAACIALYGTILQALHPGPHLPPLLCGCASWKMCADLLCSISLHVLAGKLERATRLCPSTSSLLSLSSFLSSSVWAPGTQDARMHARSVGLVARTIANQCWMLASPAAPVCVLALGVGVGGALQSPSGRRHSWRVHAEKGKLEAKLRPNTRWTKNHNDAITASRQLVPDTAR